MTHAHTSFVQKKEWSGLGFAMPFAKRGANKAHMRRPYEFGRNLIFFCFVLFDMKENGTPKCI